MIRHLFILLVLICISACSTTKVEPPKEELIIHDLTQGKMKKINGEWVIYEETKNMAYEVNDSCIYAKKPIECLRHGFKISYDSNGKDIQLECVAKTNITVNAGNNEQEKYIETNQDDFLMPLKGSEKEFVNVQYINGQPGLEDLYIETSCSLNGHQKFEFSQRIRFN